VAVVVSHAFEADGYHKGDVGGARGDRRHAKTARRTDVIGHQNTTKKHDDSGCRWLDLNGLFLGSIEDVLATFEGSNLMASVGPNPFNTDPRHYRFQPARDYHHDITLLKSQLAGLREILAEIDMWD
jgi:hypothetical protein